MLNKGATEKYPAIYYGIIREGVKVFSKNWTKFFIALSYLFNTLFNPEPLVYVFEVRATKQ